MAYRFKKGHESDKIGIKGWKQNITQENLTDDLAKVLLKDYPEFAEIIEEGEPLPKPKTTKKVTTKAPLKVVEQPEAKGESTPASEPDLK